MILNKAQEINSLEIFSLLEHFLLILGGLSSKPETECSVEHFTLLKNFIRAFVHRPKVRAPFSDHAGEYFSGIDISSHRKIIDAQVKLPFSAFLNLCIKH